VPHERGRRVGGQRAEGPDGMLVDLGEKSVVYPTKFSLAIVSQGEMNNSSATLLLIALIGVVILTVCLYNQNSGWDYFRPRRGYPRDRCPPGYVGWPGCFKPCKQDSDCPSGDFCQDKLCQGGCQSDNECPSGEKCFKLPQRVGKNFCYRPCKRNSDCPSDERCCDDPRFDQGASCIPKHLNGRHGVRC